jgi:peroxiredoxin (alkyl hydroperoxide reductase subunit C)
MIIPGQKLPAFKLRACVSTEKGKEFSDITNEYHAGKWLVLYFYPKDFTFVCPTEIVEYDNAQKELADRDAVLLGGSTDNEFSHLAWRKAHADLGKITHPLVFLSPTFANQLGVIHPEVGVALRATLIIDPQGVVRHVTVNDLAVGRNVKETIRTLDAFQTGELCPCDWKPGDKTLG